MQSPESFKLDSRPETASRFKILHPGKLGLSRQTSNKDFPSNKKHRHECAHHLVRKLDAQMAQPSGALNDHNVPSHSLGVPQRVEDGQPWRGHYGGKSDFSEEPKESQWAKELTQVHEVKGRTWPSEAAVRKVLLSRFDSLRGVTSHSIFSFLSVGGCVTPVTWSKGAADST